MTRALSIGSLLLILLTSTGCAIFEPPLDATARFFRNLTTPAGPSARKMEDKDSADNRREGINELADRNFGLRPPYTTRYQQIALTDPDYTVRAIAIRALNRARDNQAGPVFVQALEDKSELVRLEAAKALVNLPNREAIPNLLKHLQPTYPTGVVRNDERGRPVAEQKEESRDVRIAVADALKHYRSLDVARSLVTSLDARDFSVAYQARMSLRNLTSNDLGYNGAAWLEYLTGPSKPLG